MTSCFGILNFEIYICALKCARKSECLNCKCKFCQRSVKYRGKIINYAPHWSFLQRFGGTCPEGNGAKTRPQNKSNNFVISNDTFTSNNRRRNSASAQISLNACSILSAECVIWRFSRKYKACYLH